MLLVTNVDAQSEEDSTVTYGITFFGYPYLFYTPETNLAFGAGGIMYFRTAKKPDLNLSSILLSGYYTINNQYSLTLTPELYFSHNKYIARGTFNFGKFLDKFYGYGSNSEEIDNPDYFTQNFGVNLNFQADVSEYFEIDFVFFPTNGGYYIFSVVYYQKAIGSDFEFNDYLLDLRRYFKLAQGHILTFQLYGNFARGFPPFYEMPRLGGSITMRGYFEGRFRDRNYVAAQAEYKTWLVEKWKLAMVVFGGVGDVANNLDDLILKDFKYSYGFGLRYIFDEKERLTVRADFGFGKNTSGVYFAMQEAF
jgi:hypothetical protein